MIKVQFEDKINIDWAELWKKVAVDYENTIED